MSFWSISLYSQCSEVIKEAKEKINPNSSNRDYEKAINLLLYAQGVCPIEKKGEIDTLITKTFKLITAEKDRATRAEIQAKNEKDNAIKAEKETKKTAISALNSTLALELTTTNPTLAIRVAEYNLNKNPKNESAYDMFKQIYSQEHLYYKLSLTGHSLPIRAVDISDDSKYLVTASMDGKTNIWNLNGRLIFTFQHIESIYDISFSSDNEYIDTYVIDGNYKTRKIRWTLNGKQISDEVINNKSPHFYTMSYLDPNGYLVNSPHYQNVTNGIDTIKVSQLLGHETIITNALGQEATIYDAEISADGRYIITGGADKTAKLWVIPPSNKTVSAIFIPEAAGTVLRNQLLDNHEYYYESKNLTLNNEHFHFNKNEDVNYNSPIGALSFSQDEKYFAIAYYDFNENNRLLVSGCAIYEASSKKFISEFSQKGIIYDINFSKENSIVTKNITGQLSNWSFNKTGKAKIINDTIVESIATKIDLDDFLYKIEDFGKYFVGKNKIKFDDFDKYDKYIDSLIDTLRSPYLLFYDHNKGLSSTIIDQDLDLPSKHLDYLGIKSKSEKYLLTANKNRDVILWENWNRFLPEIKVLDYRWTRNLGFSDDGNYFYFSSTKKGKKRIKYSQWDFQKSTDLLILLTALSKDKGWTKEFEIPNQNGNYNRVKSISLSEDGNYLAATIDGDDYSLIVWNVESEKVILQLPRYEDIRSVKFLPKTNQLIAIRGNPGTKAVFINLDGKILDKRIPLNSYPIDSPIFEISSKEDFLLIGGQFFTEAKTIEVWDYKKEKKITSIYHPYDIECAVFLPTSNHIAIGSQDGSIKIFDLKGNLLNTIKGHDGYVYDIKIAPKEGLIYSTGEDNFLRCWSMNGDEIWNKEFSKEISYLAIDPSGEFILTSSNGGINIISTKENKLNHSICKFDANDYFKAGLHINENEVSTDLEYEILALKNEQDRNWDKALECYNKIANKDINPAVKSRAFLLEEISNIDQFESYLDVTNGPMLLRFFKKLNEKVITEENELFSLYDNLQEQSKKDFLKTQGKFGDMVSYYKRAILFSEKSRVKSLVSKDLCNYFNGLAWYCILINKDQEAEGLILEGIRLCGNNSDLKIRLITTLLVQKKYDKVKEVISSTSLNESFKKENSFHHKPSFYNQFQQYENMLNREVLLKEIEFFESLNKIDAKNAELNKIKKMIQET